MNGKRSNNPGKSALRTAKANANRKAALRKMVKLGWVPGKGWPNGIDPRKGNGEQRKPRALSPLDIVERRAPLRAPADDVEFQFVLDVARLIVARKLGGK